ncbi:Target SNARE coiled-coil domain [Phytophthora cinnamomi]|uniref:Target SNARE coiled-coil domain n=1 Tax=Phytophthora cinnamomi TaxID=4785 RepID=UPI003559C5E2|nr:Target SNARE coiled-coil domain [Phytophthora cinnamomi]
MSRELDGLLDKLSRINQEMGGEEGKGKKKDKKGDQFHELKTKIGERLHHLKMTLQENDVAATKRGKHPREAIRRQQEIREDIRLVGVDIKDLTTSYDLEMKKRKSKFSPEELAMRKEIVTQYWAEYERIKELAAANYRSPAGRTTFDTGGVAAPIGSFENGAFTARTKPAGALGGPVFGGLGGGLGGGAGGGGGGDGPIEREVVTDDQRAMLADIQRNDQRFDNMIEQIGTGVQELGQQARMLNEELQQQAIMIDGLSERIDTTQAHVESVNRKMKRPWRKLAEVPTSA